MTRNGRIWMALVAAAALAGATATVRAHEGEAHADQDHAAGTQVTMEGEVVDLHCFMLHPDTGQGAEHIGCAKTCMNKGLPIGFLSEGQLFLLLGQGHDSVKAAVVKLAGVPVTLKGTLVEHHGIKAIQVSSAVKKGGTKAAAAKADDKTAAKEVWVCPMGCAKSDKPGKCPACGMEMEKKKG